MQLVLSAWLLHTLLCLIWNVVFFISVLEYHRRITMAHEPAQPYDPRWIGDIRLTRFKYPVEVREPVE